MCDVYTAAFSLGIGDEVLVEQVCGASECCRNNNGVLDEACFPSEYSASFEDCTALDDQSDYQCCNYQYQCSLRGNLYPDDPGTLRVCSVAECCQESNGTFSICYDKASGSSQPTPSPQSIDPKTTESPFGFTLTADSSSESTPTPFQATTKSPSIAAEVPGSVLPSEDDKATESHATDETGALVSTFEDDVSVEQTKTPTAMVGKEPQAGQESTNGVARKATCFLSLAALYFVLT